MKNLTLLLIATLASCAQNDNLETIGKLPAQLGETSAAEQIGDKIWTTEDHGNAAELYALDLSGKLTDTLKISGLKNEDWEELSSDKNGNLYIGDFGNNKNDRKDLSIYRVDSADLNSEKAKPTQKTTFYYPDQKEFPPKKSERIFDCEAFFAFGDYFYLFSKNRSSKFDGTSILYRVPNKPGNFAAEKISEFTTCNNYNRCAVTSADISPDGKKVAILTSDKIFVFTDFKADDFYGGTAKEIKLHHFSQKEGMCFSTDSEILITDEREKQTGGNLYKFRLEAKP